MDDAYHHCQPRNQDDERETPMPRASREAKAASHARIVEAAAREFREKGIEGAGVADIMAATGLTHGGFYRHFNSKDDLAAAAIGRGFDEGLARLEAALAGDGGESALAKYIDLYLSCQHVSNPGAGCPIVALGAETARSGSGSRAAIAEGIGRLIGRLAEAIGGDQNDARLKASGLLAVLVGAVTLARSAPSEEARNAILAAGRQLARQSLQR
jgi:TetR/AcrR family transcriptional repressor of nem operon